MPTMMSANERLPQPGTPALKPDEVKGIYKLWIRLAGD
jgi:hypothetical protein